MRARLYEFFVLDDSARWRSFMWIIPMCAVIGTAADFSGIPRSVSIPLVGSVTIGLLFIAALLCTREMPPRLTDGQTEPELSQISAEVQTFLATVDRRSTSGARFSFAIRLFGLSLGLLIHSAIQGLLRRKLTDKEA